MLAGFGLKFVHHICYLIVANSFEFFQMKVSVQKVISVLLKEKMWRIHFE